MQQIAIAIAMILTALEVDHHDDLIMNENPVTT